MDAENVEENQEQLYSCPTFSSYSSNNNLASIALRVAAADEFQSNASSGEFDFEFSSIERDQIKTVYPIFSRDIRDDVIDFEIGVPLRRLLIEEREQGGDVVDSSASSSEEDEEIANIPAGTYCVWKPKKVGTKDLSKPNMCNKSNSTGSTSSKRWKIMDLLRRSNSEGNANYLYLAPKQHRPEKYSEKTDHQRRRNQASKMQLDTVTRRAGESKARVKKAAAVTVGATPSAHETFYVRNRAIKESDKRKSYMPQVLVGVFANVNALTRSYPPF